MYGKLHSQWLETMSFYHKIKASIYPYSYHLKNSDYIITVILRCPRIIWTEPVKTDSDKNPLATRDSSTPRKHTSTWHKHTALLRLCQGKEIRMTTPWRKTSSPFWKLNVSTDTNRLLFLKQMKWLTAISTSTTMSASSSKLERRRWRNASPTKTCYFLPGVFFVLSAQSGAVQSS